MLKAAQLYAEELQAENIKSWYQVENIYFHGGPGEYAFELPEDNENQHIFVSVDKKDNIHGYIGYTVDWNTRTAWRFGIISFRKGSLIFAKDLYCAICDIFEKYHLNRMEWTCYADNPAIRGYRNFIKKHGGRECGYKRQRALLKDGRLHDAVEFEIMAEEFRH